MTENEINKRQRIRETKQETENGRKEREKRNSGAGSFKLVYRTTHMITPTTTTYSNDHPSECLRECPRKYVSIDSDRVKPLIHTAEVSIFVFGCEISKHKISNEAIERTRAILRFLFTVLSHFLFLFLPPNIKLELKTYSIRSMHLNIVEI